MLSRILIEELGQRLPQSTVFSESGAVTASPDATLELNFQRLDEDAAGNLVLQAQASTSFKGRPEPDVAQFPICRDAADGGTYRARSPRSAPRLASSPTGSRRCWPPAGDAVRGGSTDDRAAAAGMPGLRIDANRSGPGAGHDRAMRAVPDYVAAHQRPSFRPHHRADRGRVHIAGRHVLDDIDERRNRRHQARRRPVLGARRAGSPEHGRARSGHHLRDRTGAADQACRHALCADPSARNVTARPSAHDLRLGRAAAPMVDARGLRVRRVRRVCEARRSGDDRARGRRLCTARADLCAGLDRLRARP